MLKIICQSSILLSIILNICRFYFNDTYINFWWAPDAYQLINTIFIGLALSYFFTYLMVIKPTNQRNRYIKDCLKRHYFQSKCKIIHILLSLLSDKHECPDNIEDLCDPAKFEAFFSKSKRWYDIKNNLRNNPKLCQEILNEFQILKNTFSLTFTCINTTHQKTINVFINFCSSLDTHKQCNPDYDEVKTLTNFLWQFLASYDIISGKCRHDVIEEAIDSIDQQ